MREMKEMIAAGPENEAGQRPLQGGLARWLIERFRRGPGSQPRLALLDRISLAPRQSLALVEADGRRLLVATSPQAAPAFYVLDARPALDQQRRRSFSACHPKRISW